MIRAEELTFDYERLDEEGNVESKKRAVDHVNLHIRPGKFIAVLGHNGSGKSTLAKHINAILMPAEGTLWVDGMDTKEEGKLWSIRQEAGMVFQNPDNQIIGTVVEEDVGFGPENLGVPTDEIWRRVEESLGAVGMLKYRHHSPNRLSGGQKQRVAIARAMANDPAIILADEPTGALDSKTGRLVMDLFHQLNREQGKTIVFITHNGELAAETGRMLTMRDGLLYRGGEGGE